MLVLLKDKIIGDFMKKNKLTTLGCLGMVAILAFAGCGEETEHTHTYSDAWSSNATQHWHAATCGHGENKADEKAHEDTNEDGLCDVCNYEVGHTHTFEETWQSDEENHWKKASCSHTDEIGEQGLHKDEDVNGECDVCGGHVHTINEYGFCGGCDKETKPVDENALGSVVYATAARKKFVTGGCIDYKFAGTNKTEGTTDRMEHIEDFSLGTNGTYMKRTLTNVKGETETLEKYIQSLPNGDAKGIAVSSVNGSIVNAEPSSFSADSLLGYYYAVSTFADGHGAENLLKALYEQTQNTDAVQGEVEVVHDKENKNYSFKFDSLIVHETNVAQGDNVGGKIYNVNLFELEVSFTYDDNYSLTQLTVNCDCYTNDPGADMGGNILEADIDLDYDPSTGSYYLRNTAAPDTYTITVTQNTGTRAEIDMKDGSEYTPTAFALENEGTAIETLELAVGGNTTLNLVAMPEGTYLSFVKDKLVVSVTKKGESTNGLSAIMQGYNELNLYPRAPGNYVITLSCEDVVKTLNVTVTGLELGGTNTFSFTSTDNNAWNQTYEFKAPKQGTYTFYIPYGLGVATYTELDSYGDPLIKDEDIIFDYAMDALGIEGTISFSKALRKGQTLLICFKCRDRDFEYTIGYDEP